MQMTGTKAAKKAAAFVNPFDQTPAASGLKIADESRPGPVMREVAGSSSAEGGPVSEGDGGSGPPPTASNGDLLELRLAEIVESSTNPRRRFDYAALKELTDSIRETGVQVPIVCRPSPRGYQLVAGHRRFRASKLAGRTSIPAIVRDLTDLQVIEIQFVENGPREGVHPLDEADALGKLRDGGADLDAIARKAGKGHSWVAKRLQLLQLDKYFQDLWTEKNAIGVEQALIIARLSPAQQKSLKTECKRDSWLVEETLHKTAALRDHLARAFERDLAGVHFDRDAVDLLPKAGSCTSCTKRTGAQTALFDDTKADKCLDPDCFNAKREAFVAMTIAATKASDPTKREPVRVGYETGQVQKYTLDIITPAQAKKLPDAQVRYGVTSEGEVLIYKAKTPSKSRSASSTATAAAKLKQANAERDERLNLKILDAIQASVHVDKQYIIRAGAAELFARLHTYSDDKEMICKRRGWLMPKRSAGVDWMQKAAVAFLDNATPEEVLGFIAECSLIRLVFSDVSMSREKQHATLRTVAEVFDVDVRKVKADFEAAEKASAESTPATSSKLKKLAKASAKKAGK